MSGTAIVAHAFGLAHGLAAGLVSFGVFRVAGLLLFPRRWAAATGPSAAAVGAAFYVAACWTAITQRDIPLIYIIPLFAGTLVAIAIARARSLGPVLRAALSGPLARQRLAAFSIFYALTYLLIVPPAGDSFLPLAPARNLDLVTHARYARHSLEVGTPDDLDLAPFAYRRSPATSYLIAWQSMFFSRDPLTAAMPTLFAVASVFGLITLELLRSTGLPHRVSVGIACIVLSGPLFRWVIAGYGLPALLGAAALLLLMSELVALWRREARGPAVSVIIASCLLIFFAEPLSREWFSSTALASGRVLANVSALALAGWPGRIAQVRSADVILSALFLLPLITIVWTVAAYVVGRWQLLHRLQSGTDRDLARALASYLIVALVIGNIAVDALRDPGSARVPAAWRGLEEVNRQPFRGLTVKMSDDLDSLSTAIALYFLSTKRATVVGADVNDEEVKFDAISRQTPIFIHNFGCPGAGHDDTLTVTGIGCLMLAPPTAALETRYPLNRRFLFMSYEGMSARTPDGRFSTRPTLPLRVTADPQRARLDRPLHLNVLVDPLLPTGEKPQRLVFRWGGRRGETSVDRREWLSVPIDTEDWIGNRLWTVLVNIDFPDGRPILFHELSITEAPQGRLIGAERAQ
jgi:hypothetical protein